LWPTASSALTTVAATAATALAVKLLDDGLDRERDLAAGFPNWAAALGRGAPAYALVTFALGCALAAPTAVPLLLAAYAVGMGRSGARQPSGLPAWVEGALALAVAAAAFGIIRAAAAAAAMLAIQWTDGLVDWRADAGYRQPRLERGPLAALAGAAWAAALALDPAQGLAVAGCGLGVALLTRRRGAP
jgi:hypothetical protein